MHDRRALDHGQDVCGCVDPAVKVNVDDRLVIQIPNRLSIGTLDNDSLAILPILSGNISHGEAYRTISCSLI